MVSRGAYAKGTQRRQEILDTALDVIARNGYHRTTLRGIGRELGIEPAHILYYFDSREGLLVEVIEGWDRENLRLAGHEADALSVYASALRHNVSIRGIVHLYLAFAAEAAEPAHPAHEFFRRRFAQNVIGLADTIGRGVGVGLIRPELDPERTARMLISLADGLQLQALMDDRIDAPGDLESAIDALFIGGRRMDVPGPPRLLAESPRTA